MDSLKKELEEKLQKAIDYLSDEMKKVRSGRAHASLLDGVVVEAYGQTSPLPHIARVLASDARTITVTPYDSSTLAGITKAIRDDKSLGLNPVDDGKIIRVPIPEMTTERREQLLKLVGEKAEECRIAFRSARHDVLEKARSMEKNSEASQDDLKRLEHDMTAALDNFQSMIDDIVKNKEQEIMTV